MLLSYPANMPKSAQYQYCPKCRGALVEILDEEDIPRAKCPECGWIYFPCNVQLVNIVITTVEGLVFLFPPDEPADCPAALPGGVVEYGETPEEAAVREAREETGLQVEVIRELRRIFYPDFPFGPSLSYIFETREVGGTLRDGLEGRVAVFAEESFPVVSRFRKGSQRALAAYLEAKRHNSPQQLPTTIEKWRE